MTEGDLTLADGSVSVTDGDNAASLSVTNNTITTADALVDISSTTLTTGAMMRINANTGDHDGEILELINAGDATSTGTGLSVTMPSITTGGAKGINVVMTGATTTAKGISVTMDALTTGNMLYLENGGNTITEGKFINCNDDNASVFSVAASGLTTIAGSASGTDALVLTAGDLTLTSGDLTVSGHINNTKLVADSTDILNNDTAFGIDWSNTGKTFKCLCTGSAAKVITFVAATSADIGKKIKVIQTAIPDNTGTITFVVTTQTYDTSSYILKDVGGTFVAPTLEFAGAGEKTLTLTPAATNCEYSVGTIMTWEVISTTEIRCEVRAIAQGNGTGGTIAFTD